MKRFWLSISSLIFALPVFADAIPTTQNYKNEITSPSPFLFRPYMAVSAGYGAVENMKGNDGQSAIARLALGFDSFSWWMATFGAELGVQTGNTMRRNSVPALGTASIQLTLKPVLDLLITAKIHPVPEMPMYLILKGGIAYRHLQVNDRDSIPSLRRVNGEFQAGIGYTLTQHTSLIAYYQGIYGGDCGCVTVNSVAHTGAFKNIPTQEAGFIGLEYAA